MAASPVVRYFELLHQLTLDQADDLQRAVERIMEAGSAVSPFSRDHRKVLGSARNNDRLKLWQAVQHACLHVTVNVADHVRTLAMVLSHASEGVPVYAHASIARVAVEGAAYIAYLLDAGEPFETRFARGIAFLIADSDHARRAASKVPGNLRMKAPGPAARQDHHALIALINRAKIEVVPNRKGDPKGVRVAPGADEARVDVKVSELVEAQYPDMPGLYSLMSGVTHGMAHKLSDNAWFADRHAHWNPDPLDVGCSVLAAVNAAHTVVTAHAWQHGAGDDASIGTTGDRIALVDMAMLRFGRAHLRLPEPVFVGDAGS